MSATVCVAQSLLINQLLMHHLVNNDGLLMYGFMCAQLDVWIGWLLVFFDFAIDGSHLFSLSVTGGPLFLAGRHFEVQVDQKDFSITKRSSLVFLPLSRGRNAVFCTRVLEYTILCSTRQSKRKTCQEDENGRSLFSSKHSVHWPLLPTAC